MIKTIDPEIIDRQVNALFWGEQKSSRVHTLRAYRLIYASFLRGDLIVNGKLVKLPKGTTVYRRPSRNLKNMDKLKFSLSDRTGIPSMIYRYTIKPEKGAFIKLIVIKCSDHHRTTFYVPESAIIP